MSLVDQFLGVAWREKSFGQRLKFGLSGGKFVPLGPRTIFLGRPKHRMNLLISRMSLNYAISLQNLSKNKNYHQKATKSSTFLPKSPISNTNKEFRQLRICCILMQLLDTVFFEHRASKKRTLLVQKRSQLKTKM